MDILGLKKSGPDEDCQTAPSILTQRYSTSTTLQYINCLYTNADSLHNKMSELEIRLNSRRSADEIHIIAITEVNNKINSSNIELYEYEINGFDMFYTNLTPKEGRGIILYVKRELEATPVVLNVQFQESVWISIPTNNNKNNGILVGCIYRSPNSSDENNSQLSQLLKAANTNKYTNVLILSDFNFPHVNWELEQANTLIYSTWYSLETKTLLNNCLWKLHSDSATTVLYHLKFVVIRR